MRVEREKAIKYALDRVLAALILLCTAPLLLVIALAIRLDSRGGSLFLQERVGEAGTSFTIFKFRTMISGSGQHGLGATTAADDQRITKVGKFLRESGLDELPQLINILRGEMSFIGPRPTLRYQVDGYTPTQAQRLLFRPGVSGWAQVHGRNELPWEDRIELDLYYVHNYSLWLDVRILFRTVLVVLRRQGVYASDGANDDFTSRLDASPNDVEDQRRCTTPSSTVDHGATANDRELVVIGAGGHASVVIDAILADGRYSIVGLVDDHPQHVDVEVLGCRVIGNRDVLGRIGIPRRAVVALGSPREREEFVGYLERLGFELPVIKHPTAQVGMGAEIGSGTVMLAGSIVNARTRIGRAVILNTGASVDHDCRVADFCHIAPGARLAGNVQVGRRTHVGIGASVIQSIHIGSDVTIGAGAAVVRDIPPETTAVGVPARPVRKFDAARAS